MAGSAVPPSGGFSAFLQGDSGGQAQLSTRGSVETCIRADCGREVADRGKSVAAARSGSGTIRLSDPDADLFLVPGGGAWVHFGYSLGTLFAQKHYSLRNYNILKEIFWCREGGRTPMTAR